MVNLAIKDSPDFSFIILENTANKPDMKIIQWDSEHKRLRSVGEISNLLEMHDLMSKSLDIMAPLGTPVEHCTGQPMYNQSGIFFAPDFPDFLLPLDHPNYRQRLGLLAKLLRGVM